MKRVRRQRLRSALVLVVMAALLWSQTVLAHHALCTVSPLSLTVVTHGEAADCHRTSQSVDSVICDTHCSQGELSHDASRGLSVPALGPVPFVPAMVLVPLPQNLTRTDPAPLRSWHRPTPHPASLLLI
jgi:hypothetical protein